MYGLSEKWWVYWTLSVFLLSGATSYGQTPTPSELANKPKHKNAVPNKNAASDQRGTEQSPLVVKILPSPSSDIPANDTGNEKHNDTPQGGWNREEWWSDHIVEIILAVATVLLWVATRDLVRGAEKTAERQLRAYIAVKEDATNAVKDIEMPNGGHALEIRMLMKNVGQTPAFKLTQWTSAKVDRETISLPGQDHEPDQGIYMPPGVEMCFVTRIDTPWTTEMLAMETGDGMCLHIWGEINYRDIFNVTRFVKFRFIKKEGDTGKELEFYRQGNDAN